jgi:hypothetical protein
MHEGSERKGQRKEEGKRARDACMHLGVPQGSLHLSANSLVAQIPVSVHAFSSSLSPPPLSSRRASFSVVATGVHTHCCPFKTRLRVTHDPLSPLLSLVTVLYVFFYRLKQRARLLLRSVPFITHRLPISQPSQPSASPIVRLFTRPPLLCTRRSSCAHPLRFGSLRALFSFFASPMLTPVQSRVSALCRASVDASPALSPSRSTT